MRRAGFEVRVIPFETGSFEGNPPTVSDFIRREKRWCRGNLQYLSLLSMPGLLPVSRFQIVSAIAMYLAAPAWMIMTATILYKVLSGETAVRAYIGISLFLIMVGISLAPKAVGLTAFLSGRSLSGGRGTGWRRTAALVRDGIGETLFSMILSPVVAFSLTLHVGRLLLTWLGQVLPSIFGVRYMTAFSISRPGSMWSSQNRSLRVVSWRAAMEEFWPHTGFGLLIGAASVLQLGWPGAAWIMPISISLSLSIPFAVMTTRSWLHDGFRNHGVFSLGEFRDIDPA